MPIHGHQLPPCTPTPRSSPRGTQDHKMSQCRVALESRPVFYQTTSHNSLVGCKTTVVSLDQLSIFFN